LIRWHHQGIRLFWGWKSQRGRPPIPQELQALIRHMAEDNPTWGEERIANELLLKMGLRVSPRTVRKYLPHSHDCRPTPGVSSQRWRTFVRNHAQAIIACDFCVAVTATSRLLYVFVMMEHATLKSCLPLSRDSPRQRGPSNNCVQPCQRTMPIASSSTTGIAFSLSSWISRCNI